jgi:uncharacterized protein YecE (DUF72 family)
MEGNLWLGCSGWSYDEWVGTVYKNTTESKLAAYSNLFDVVEINSTFYRNPTKGTVLGWRKHSPDGFIFTAKIPQKVTHDKMIDVSKGVKDDLDEFCALMELLLDSGKLQCLLIQLPPRMTFKLDDVREFFGILPEGFRYAIEFRNRSWMCKDAYDLLREFKIAYTIVDEPLLPPEIHITSDFSYIRWHGKGKRPWYNYRYSLEELEPWIPELKGITEKTETTYGFFNNHYHGYAPENCIQVLEMMGAITPEQVELKKRIKDFREDRILVSKSDKPKIVRATLDDFETKGLEDLDVTELLELFMDKGRLGRAKAISDRELRIEESGEEVIRARIRDYSIELNSEAKMITHDCGDWSRCAINKAFCKHLGKLMLSLPEERAKTIMTEIQSKPESWDFKT